MQHHTKNFSLDITIQLHTVHFKEPVKTFESISTSILHFQQDTSYETLNGTQTQFIISPHIYYLTIKF